MRTQKLRWFLGLKDGKAEQYKYIVGMCILSKDTQENKESGIENQWVCVLYRIELKKKRNLFRCRGILPRQESDLDLNPRLDRLPIEFRGNGVATFIPVVDADIKNKIIQGTMIWSILFWDKMYHFLASAAPARSM